MWQPWCYPPSGPVKQHWRHVWISVYQSMNQWKVWGTICVLTSCWGNSDHSVNTWDNVNCLRNLINQLSGLTFYLTVYSWMMSVSGNYIIHVSTSVSRPRLYCESLALILQSKPDALALLSNQTLWCEYVFYIPDVSLMMTTLHEWQIPHCNKSPLHNQEILQWPAVRANVKLNIYSQAVSWQLTYPSNGSVYLNGQCRQIVKVTNKTRIKGS